MATRYAFSIDLDRCIGCQACVISCQAGNELKDDETYIHVGEQIRGNGNTLWGSFDHHRCFHCADAPCVTACPTGTLTKWNGLTIVDKEKCSACGYCTDACPFKVPRIVDNHVSKCVACLDQVKEGQAPWCARTCPSQAIHFGERDTILAEAKTKVAALKARHPNAQVYGETQLGGLGLLMILLDKPEVYGLPLDPKAPETMKVWQNVVQPASSGLSVLAAGAMGLMFVFARRQHGKERAEHERVAKEKAAQKNAQPAEVETHHD